MKKILILVIMCFFTSGCYDYVELNDLSIVSGIGIDKNENEYEITYEILNDKKQGKESAQQKSILISGTGSTLPEALINATKKSPKQAYFAHLKLLVLSNSVADEDMEQLVEYFLRNPNIRSEFYMVITTNSTSKDIYDSASEESPVISEQINTMIERNFKTKNNITTDNFEKIVIDFLEKGYDAIIPTISLEEKEISLNGNALFDGYNLKSLLDSEESLNLNILKSEAKNAIYSFNCPNNSEEKITLNIYDSGTEFKIDDKNKLKIKVSLMAEIKEYACKDSLKDIDTYQKYDKLYAKEFETKLNDFYQILIDDKADVLGIGKKLYNKTRKYDKDAWANLEYDLNVDLKINKDGLIFEVKDGN